VYHSSVTGTREKFAATYRPISGPDVYYIYYLQCISFMIYVYEMYYLRNTYDMQNMFIKNFVVNGCEVLVR